jgi:hypothetical protein
MIEICELQWEIRKKDSRIWVKRNNRFYSWFFIKQHILHTCFNFLLFWIIWDNKQKNGEKERNIWKRMNVNDAVQVMWIMFYIAFREMFQLNRWKSLTAFYIICFILNSIQQNETKNNYGLNDAQLHKHWVYTYNNNNNSEWDSYK